MTKRARGWGSKLVEAAIGSFGSSPEEPFDEHSDRVSALEAQVADLQRRNREYFDVIERIEAQRDEWQRMFDEQTRMNMNAHRMYQRKLEVASHQLRKAVTVLNKYLVEDGHEPVKDKEALFKVEDDVGVGYAERVAEIKEQAAEPVDGQAERAWIAEGSELEVTPPAASDKARAMGCRCDPDPTGRHEMVCPVQQRRYELGKEVEEL